MTIQNIAGEEELGRVKALFQEYWDAFGFTPCFQVFDTELATLPGKYAAPLGRLAVARVDGEIAGCVALRPADGRRCEMKRLYVRPQFRACGVGRALLEWVVGEARSIGYAEMVCDTMPVMSRALAMYERFGFERTEPSSDDATDGAIDLRLGL